MKIELIRRNIAFAEFARRIGLTPLGFSTQLSKGVPSKRSQARIEMGFDYALPIWTKAKPLAARARCARVLGFDPAVATVAELRQHARRLGIDPGPGFPTHKQLTEAIFSFLAANPRMKSATSTTTPHSTTPKHHE